MLSVWKGRNKTLSSSASNFLFQEYTNPVAPAVVTYGQFGSPLNPNGDAPPLFNKLVRFLQQKALNTEKIFLPQPNLDAEIQNIKKSVMKDITQLAENNDNFQLASYTKNPHVIADITKQYLSALPEPLLTFHLYDSFLLTYKMSNENDRVWGFRFLLAFLPPGFRASVKLLLTLLHRVTLSYENSRMDARALAEIFAPYFLRPEEELFYMKDDQATAVDIITLLISECDNVLKTVTNALRPAMPTPSVFPKAANANQQPTSTPQSNSPTLSRGATESHPLEILSQTPPKLKPAAGTIPGEPIIKITPAHFDHRPSIPNKVIPPTPVAAASNSANPSPAVSPRTTTPPPIVVASPSTISTPSSLSPLSHTSISTPSLLSPAPTPPLTPLDASYEMISASPAPVVSQISDPLRARGLTDFALSPSMPPQPTSSKSSLGLSTAPTLSPLIVSTPQYDSDNTAGSPTNISPISSPTITNGEATPNPKLDKLRASVSNIIVSQVTPQLIETLRGILLAETQGVAMAGARILLDTKKVLADAMATNLNATKDDVAAFISTNPRTPTILPDVEQKEDIKLAKLRQAAFGAVEQILDLLHYVKVKLAETQEAKYAVAIGHTVRALKTSLESQPSTTLSRMPSVGTVTNVLRDSSLIASGLRESSSDPLPDPTLSPTPSVPTTPTPTQQTSPPSSPTDPLQQAPIVRSHSTSTVPPPTGHNPTARPMSQSNPAVTMSPRDTVLLTLDKHAYEAHSKITQTQACVAECSHKGLVEAARGVRFAKQCLTETMDSLSLPAIPDYRVDPVEGEDQISTLRRALPASLQKVADQINALSEHIHNNGFLDPRPIETCFGLVVRALIVPV